MRFLFVDKITAESTGATESTIAGTRFFGRGDPMRRGNHVVPGAICEAIGQLASWCCIAKHHFAARPVFLFADAIELHRPVETGSLVELTARIYDETEASLRFSGEARVNGLVVQSLRDVSASLLPLAEVEDPEVTRSRYAALIGAAGLQLQGIPGSAYDFASLVGETTAFEVGRMIRTRQQLAATEPFYADHFPRFPVTPIVMLNEMLGVVAGRLFGPLTRVELKAIREIKIRNFIRPGDLFETSVTVEHWTPGSKPQLVGVMAEISKDGKRILRGHYEFEVEGASDVPERT